MPSPAKADAVPSQRRPRSRKSIAHFPSSEMNADSENTDPLSLPQGPSVKSKSAAKKTRSKSLGPGGLDALQETSGNRRRVSMIFRKTQATLLTRVVFRCPCCPQIDPEAYDTAIAVTRHSHPQTTNTRQCAGLANTRPNS